MKRWMIAVLVALVSSGCATPVPVPITPCEKLTCFGAASCVERASAAIERGEPDDALCYSNKAIAYDPRSVEARLGLGIAHTHMGRKPEALTDFNAVMSAASATDEQKQLARAWAEAFDDPLPIDVMYVPNAKCGPDTDAFTGRDIIYVLQRMGTFRAVQPRPSVFSQRELREARRRGAVSVVVASLRCSGPESTELAWKSTVDLTLRIIDTDTRTTRWTMHEENSAKHALKNISMNTAMAKGLASMLFRLSHALMFEEER